MKKLINISFWDNEELNGWINKNKIKREDIISINNGLFDSSVKLYLNSKLMKEALKQNNIIKKEWRLMSLLVIGGVISITIIISILVWAIK